jgi:hypothetical protein
VTQNPPQNPVVTEVINTSLAKLLGSSKTAADFAAAYKQKHGSSSNLPHLAAAAEMEVLLNPSGKAKTLGWLVGAADEGSTAQGWSHKEAVAVHQQLLKGAMADAAAAEEWKEKCGKRFRWSRYFGGEEVGEVPTGEKDAAAAAGVNGTAAGVAHLNLTQ